MARLSLFLASTLLAACSAPDPEPEADAPASAAAQGPAAAAEDPGMPPEPVPTDAEAGPAGSDSYTWVLHAEQGRQSDGSPRFPFLTYGMRHSDEILVNLQCREPGTVTVLQMRQSADPAARAPIALRSGAQSASLPISAGEPDHDGVFPATATLPVDHPLLASFRSTGRLEAPVGDRDRAADAIDPGERATIGRFFAACAG